MRVYLMRHAHAVPPGPALSDDARYLTADGRQVARRVSHTMKTDGVELDLIIASPLVRAMQTAELLAAGLDYFGEIESFYGLVPGCQPQVAAQEIATRGVNIAVVSHEPTVSSLAAFMLGVPSFQPFRPGQVCCIEDGKAVWRVDPRNAQIVPQFQ